MRIIPNTGPGKILVVERDPAVALFAETVLGVWEGFEVTAVASSGVAAALVMRDSWDLVVADYELPDAEALRLLAAVREEAPDLPFAMITAFPVLEPAATAMEGADGFVTKPMRPSDLIGLAAGLIERSRQLREQRAQRDQGEQRKTGEQRQQGEQRDRSLLRRDDLGRLAQHLGQGPLDLRRQFRIR
jgi:DNA-binding NtrC family response regulator